MKATRYARDTDIELTTMFWSRNLNIYIYFFFYDIGELHSDLLHVAKHTIQQSSLLIKLLQTTDPTHQNQLPGNPGAPNRLSSLSSLFFLIRVVYPHYYNNKTLVQKLLGSTMDTQHTSKGKSCVFFSTIISKPKS